MVKNFDDDFEVISSDEIEKAPRGRKPSAESVRVAEILSTVKTGSVALKSMKVNLNSKDAGKDKARISAIIRAGARMANVNVKISFRPSDGVAQVTIA